MLITIIGLLWAPLLVLAPAPAAWGADGWLQDRLESWPAWQLPAPLPRPRRSEDLVYPDWFRGVWEVESTDQDDGSTLVHQARFEATNTSVGAVVGDRSFNAKAIGQALLGNDLLAVEQAPGQVNRQLARLSQDRQLETTVIGRRESRLDQAEFISDELVLQILHGPGAPRISRIETLSRYERCNDTSNSASAVSTVDTICGEQWQARFAAPGDGVSAQPLSVHRYTLKLTKPLDPTASTELPAGRAS